MGCYGEGRRTSRLHADPVTIGVVAGVVSLALLILLVVFRIKYINQAPGRVSTSSAADTLCTQCTSGEQDYPGSESAAPGPHVCANGQDMFVRAGEGKHSYIAGGDVVDGSGKDSYCSSHTHSQDRSSYTAEGHDRWSYDGHDASTSIGQDGGSSSCQNGCHGGSISRVEFEGSCGQMTGMFTDDNSAGQNGFRGGRAPGREASNGEVAGVCASSPPMRHTTV
ncbi:uncharacterized protein LOC106011526 [Aplysia californica]|uniref:Uncharacterized protein LOC106011526 n=1 Tax=Aplysia californica TaxID=6500 RepID=A0ABM0ZY98_APLCA|nr:uncharacterized protein LOC106011526 [Aplysia californica]